MKNNWKELFSDSAKNTAVAADGNESIQSSKANRDKHAPFNRLEVNNRDSVDIEIRLDGLTSGGKVFQVPNGMIFGISPEDGILFTTVTQVNLSSSTAETEDAILFRWAKAELI